MSTDGTTSTPTPDAPANPAKGNLRGQTTVAAVVDRWQTLLDNLAPHIDQLPALKEPYLEFQALVAEVKALRNELKVLRANTADTLAQRNLRLVGGEELFTRLNLGLQATLGPKSARLHEFGLKPRKTRSGRPKAQPSPTPGPEIPTNPPPVELQAAPTAGAVPANPAK